MSLNHRVTNLEKAVHKLQQLVNAPRQQDGEAISDTSQTDRENNGLDRATTRFCNSNPTPPAANNTEKKWYQSFKWWKSRIQFIALIAGIGYAWITYCQWRDLRHNFTLDQRAWVGPLSTAIASEGTPDGNGIVFKVPYTNTGKTPAMQVHSWIGQTSDMKNIQDHKADSGDIAKGLLMPASVMNTSTADSPITKADAVLIGRGSPWYVHGQIWYQDIFGKEHWTRFCFIPKGEGLNAFGPCVRYNDTDDSNFGK